MFTRLTQRKPSPSMVISVLALSVALGGTGYAAAKLAPNSVGTKQLKANAVTGAKVKDASLFANDFASGQIPKGPAGAKGAPGAKGDAGPQGAKGEAGAQGPAGLSHVIVRRHPELVSLGPAAGAGADLVTMQLPAGKWLLSAVTNGLYDGTGATFNCYLRVGGAVKDTQTVALGVANGATRGAEFAPGAAVDLTAASTAVLRCDHEQAAPQTQFGPYFGNSRIDAIRADTLDVAAG